MDIKVYCQIYDYANIGQVAHFPFYLLDISCLIFFIIFGNKIFIRLAKPAS